MMRGELFLITGLWGTWNLKHYFKKKDLFYESDRMEEIPHRRQTRKLFGRLVY